MATKGNIHTLYKSNNAAISRGLNNKNQLSPSSYLIQQFNYEHITFNVTCFAFTL